LGWDKGSINVLDFTKRMEDSGAAMLCVHGRTRSMLYTGVADWEMIHKVKQQCSVPVIANGDIVSGETAVKCRKWTGADGVMIGRATFGNPWVFSEVKAALAGEEIPQRPPLAKRVDVAVRQFELAYEDKGEHIACLEARKHFAWYLRGVAYANYYKEQISHIQTMADVYQIADGIRRDLR
jgi:tRNA-dihydrouridine synthase B